MRATTILQKESGRWKIVHQHSSIGVPNDQVEAFQGFEEAVAKSLIFVAAGLFLTTGPHTATIVE
jgi:SnoaL-like domain